MAEGVYILCALTSGLCAWLLWRSYRATRTQLLLWSALCFVGFAFNNALLFTDLVLLPQSFDLSIARNSTALLSLVVLVYGLVTDTE
jgi:hypothetical protein